jgi:hypothetical protein
MEPPFERKLIAIHDGAVSQKRIELGDFLLG